MNKKAMYNLTYGLFVLCAEEDGKLNGCIINTAFQQTSEPNVISITVNKNNYTRYMVSRQKQFTVSMIDESADFSLFQHFGFQSGGSVNKFTDYSDYELAENGIPYISKGCNAYLSAKVIKEIDLGSHILFLAQVTAGEVLSDKPSMTYSFYQSNVKPKPQATASSGKVWVCKVCGYVYDDAVEKVPFEQLPEDYVCPTCKHGKQDFELVK